MVIQFGVRNVKLKNVISILKNISKGVNIIHYIKYMIFLFHEFPYNCSGLYITHLLEGLSFISTHYCTTYMYTFTALWFVTRAFMHLGMHVIIT